MGRSESGEVARKRGRIAGIDQPLKKILEKIIEGNNRERVGMPPGGRLLRVDVILHRAARFEVGPNFHRCFLLTVLFRLSDVSSLHIRFGFHLPWSFRSLQRHALCQSSALALSCSKSIALNGDGRLGTTT